MEVSGFGPWTMKAGILHVQPPPEIMSGLLAIRLHVRDRTELNRLCQSVGSVAAAAAGAEAKVVSKRIRYYLRASLALAHQSRGRQVGQEESHGLLIGVNLVLSGEPVTCKPVANKLIVLVRSLKGFR